ncbi:hypothetical protein CPC08DRAFT_771693 [Agrocybe pediades]|nr:hypothetical protein CPC08DRAFT_771693 [Agrocybe pediades]
MSRIDRIYTTQEVFKHSRQWVIEDTAVSTDHKLVSMEFTNPGTPYIGKGRWVIPLFLLENRKAKQAVEELGKKLQDKLDDLTNPEIRTEEFNVQLEFCKFKKETTKFMRNLAKTETPKLDKKIETLKEQRKQALNERLTQEEIQCNVLAIEERIKQLEMTRYKKQRDNLDAKCRLESETLSKGWVRANKERKARDTIAMLRKPVEEQAGQGGPGNEYEKRSDKMAEIARNYHDNLQRTGLEEVPEQAFTEVLDHIQPKISQRDKQTLAVYLTEDEVKRAIKDLPNGKAAGVDGIPHELWKIVLQPFSTT